MNHKFESDESVDNLCVQCGRDNTSHTDKAKCDLCMAETTCDFYPSVSKLWCPRCVGQYVREQNAKSKALKNANQEIAQQVPVTSSIFNAKIMTFVELKKTIQSDETVADVEKAYHQAIADRIIWLQNRNEEIRKEESLNKVEIMAGNHLLRQFGDKVLPEIIEKIRKNDPDYIAGKIKSSKRVDPRLGTKKKSGFDRIVEKFMKASGKSYEESKKFLEQGEHWKE